MSIALLNSLCNSGHWELIDSCSWTRRLYQYSAAMQQLGKIHTNCQPKQTSSTTVVLTSKSCKASCWALAESCGWFISVTWFLAFFSRSCEKSAQIQWPIPRCLITSSQATCFWYLIEPNIKWCHQVTSQLKSPRWGQQTNFWLMTTNPASQWSSNTRIGAGAWHVKPHGMSP